MQLLGSTCQDKHAGACLEQLGLQGAALFPARPYRLWQGEPCQVSQTARAADEAHLASCVAVQQTHSSAWVSGWWQPQRLERSRHVSACHLGTPAPTVASHSDPRWTCFWARACMAALLQKPIIFSQCISNMSGHVH